MPIQQSIFSSVRQDWGTPWSLFRKLDQEFHFDLDVCASKVNAKCKKFFTKKENGLAKKWVGNCWMNPPYGKDLSYWIRKAYRESTKGCNLVVCLIPSRTDTRWWHDWVMRGEIRFIKGRIKFEGALHPAPFPSAIVIFRNPSKGEFHGSG